MSSEPDKRILLVNTNLEKFPYPIPPVGLCMLASFLRPHYDVRVFDGVFNEGEGLIEEVKRFQPHRIGFSIRNVDDVVADKHIFYPEKIYQNFILPARKVTDVPFILGGSGFSVFPEELMQYTGADYGITGEGEELLLSVLQALDKGEPVPDHPCILRKGNLEVASGQPSGFVSLDALPFSQIDRHVDFEPYRQRGVYSIQTKRGCRLRCIYCTYPYLEGNRYRLRDPENIADEIEETIERLGPVTFEFVDSTFNEPRGHAESICRAIIRRNIRPRLRTMGINPRNTSRELFDLMMEAGFVQIDVTPDSASPAMIRNLKKGFTLKDIRHTANLIREVNLPTMWFFLFGGPGETPETVAETRRFIQDYIPDIDMVLMLSGLRIYPNTPLYRLAVGEGLVSPGQPMMHPSPYYYSDKTPKHLLDGMLTDIRDTYPNCLLAAESTPTKEMISKAVEWRKNHQVTEPMFRTLLRIRKQEKETG